MGDAVRAEPHEARAVRGPQLGMLILVPDGKSLADIEASYAAEGLTPFLTATSNHGLAAVALPKFEVGTSFELADPLSRLGMGLAFSDQGLTIAAAGCAK